MNVMMAQLNPTIGGFTGNLEKVERALAAAQASGADLVVFSELYVTGYPPRDLLERSWFIAQTQAAIDRLCDMSAHFPETALLVGAPVPTGRATGKGLYNAALLIGQGRVLFRQDKSLLPTYDVFDESRYFDAAPRVAIVPFKDEVLGLTICEDAWTDPALWLRLPYQFDPVAALAEAGATLMINISASPFWAGKEAIRYRLISGHARRHHVPFLFVNQVGANDELIFDGTSLFVDAEGRPVVTFPSFREHTSMVDTRASGAGDYLPSPTIEAVYGALVLGIRDYMRKTGFSQVVLGLSGGIDSALTCCLAVAALGREHVLGVAMPSPYSSPGSVADAQQLASNLGIDFRQVPVGDIFAAYLSTLEPVFAGREPDVTEENIQARIRGNILMAISNKFGHLLLTTGNKSEMAVGYATLYGDMAGGLAVIADVPKTMVYELARFVNGAGELIPTSTLTKPPSAELRPNQTDQDTLPPYEVLDGILRMYVDDGRSPAEIVAAGYHAETVQWVVKTINRSEYKRWQAAPVLKVTSKAFGNGRRMPIAARFEL